MNDDYHVFEVQRNGFEVVQLRGRIFLVAQAPPGEFPQPTVLYLGWTKDSTTEVEAVDKLARIFSGGD